MARARCLTLSLALVCLAGIAAADEGGCLGAADHEALHRRYEDLAARFDLADLAQRLIDLSGEAGDLKAQVAACGPDGAAKPDCEALAKRLAEKEAERQAVQVRLAAALDMQEYLATLKLRLSRPRCGE